MGMKNGLYLPQFDFDSCGVGFVANLKGVKSHKIVSDAITMLENMEHRGATGYEKSTVMVREFKFRFRTSFFMRKR